MDKKNILTNFNPVKAVIIAFFSLSFVIVVIFIVQSFLNQKPVTRIDNINTYVKDLPLDTKKSIFSLLYKTIDSNLPAQEQPPESGALVRQGTATQRYDSDIDVASGSFIVDIESVRQSYKIQYEWSQTMPNPNLSGVLVQISCLPSSLSVYQEFAYSCIDQFNAPINPDADPAQLYAHLPYFAETSSGIAYNVQQRYYGDGEVYLELNINSCGDETIEEEVKSEVQQWLKTFLATPDKYHIEIRRLCDGAI